jgi:membrane protease YdiL (CAAX protease family)
MSYIRRLTIIVMALMAILSFANLLGLNISSAAIILGVACFFINKKLEKQPMTGSGLDLSAVGPNLRDREIWFWFILPVIMDAACIAISKLFLPEYIEYETVRAGSFVPIEISISSTVLFFVFALGEEIAWRAFFQKQTCKILPFIPVLFISSFLFSLGHFKQGNIVVVVYGLFFTFINSIVYGVIFYKTENAWVSALSHFTANILEVMVFILI